MDQPVLRRPPTQAERARWDVAQGGADLVLCACLLVLLLLADDPRPGSGAR